MTTVLKISGMTCQHCVRAVTQTLQAIPGVMDVQVDLTAGAARIEGAVDPDVLITAVTEAGYSAEPA